MLPINNAQAALLAAVTLHGPRMARADRRNRQEIERDVTETAERFREWLRDHWLTD